METLRLQALAYLSGVWDRRWLCIAAAWGLCLLGWGGVALLPDRYQVESKVYIDTDSLMGPLLKGLTVAADTDQQIQIMLRTLISRPNIEQVLRATDPKASGWSPIELETRVQRLTNDILIKPLGSKNLFSISVMSTNATYAESVAQALLSLLMESSFGDKRRDMEGVQSFLDTKIAEYENLLRQSEQRVAAFKQVNADYLAPGSANRLETSQQAATAAKTELDLAMTRRDALRAQVAATPPTVSSEGAVSVVISNNGSATLSGRAGLEQRIAQESQILSDLESRYTDAHPDVVSARKMLADLKKQLAETPQNAPDDNRRQVPNTVYGEMRLKLVDEETNVALAQRKLDDANAEIVASKQVAQKVAEVQARAQDLDRDYDILRKNYQELLNRRESARLTKAEDDRQQNISFRVVEPPRRSEQPISPNRTLFNAGVMILGLAGGVAIGVLLKMSQGAFSTKDSLLEEFDLPIIGIVTRVRKPDDVRNFRLSALAVGVAMLTLVVCFAGVLATITRSVRVHLGA